ncbi:MAG: ATP-binding cassette domain-containing protein [Acidobacteriota bacterium]
MIEAQDLSRRYDDFTAVDGITFSVAEGEILGMLGPNGAGKTTTIRMITGFLPPSGGTVTVAGHDLFRDPEAARRQIGYLPENVALYPDMRVREYLAYRARLQHLSRRAGRDAIEEAMRRCLIDDVAEQIIGTLSKGYRQRVGLAAAILHDPAVLVLDEPTVGLDPRQIIAIRQLIREIGARRTLLLSTHILPEVEQLCNRVLIIDRGRLVAEGTPGELRRRAAGHPVVRVTFDNVSSDGLERLSTLDGVLAARTADAGSFELEHDGARDLRRDLFEMAVARGWTMVELYERKPSMEDIFVRLTTRDQAETADLSREATRARIEAHDELQRRRADELSRRRAAEAEAGAYEDEDTVPDPAQDNEDDGRQS